MLFLYWSIFLIIFPHIILIQAAITWDVKLCFHEKYNFIRVSLDSTNYVNVTSEKEQNCFDTEFQLDNATKPRFVEFELYNETYSSFEEFDKGKVNKATVQNHGLPEIYKGDCKWNFCNETRITLHKMITWTVEVIRSGMHDDGKGSFHTFHDELISISFNKNSRTSNTSFLLPKKRNQVSSIHFSNNETFWLDKKVKLKNMETSQIYSCIFISHPHDSGNSQHRCFLINESTWKIELTSQSKLTKNLKDLGTSVGVSGSAKDSSQIVRFQKLVHLPMFGAFMNILHKKISEVEIHFKSNKQSFQISRIVMTKMLTGEEYGCVNIHRKHARNYSCKILESKNWLLKVVSPEEQERSFLVEIVQDALSSVAGYLTWKSFCVFGDSYIKYFNLKTYEDKEITNLNLHFDNKAMSINEISLISNYSEYKFKRNEENNTQNSLVQRFSRITKAKINSNGTILIMEIVIGLLAVVVSILVIIIIRYLILRKITSKSSISECRITHEDKKNCSMQDTNSAGIYKPMKSSENRYENMDRKPLVKEFAEDGCDSYAVQ